MPRGRSSSPPADLRQLKRFDYSKEVSRPGISLTNTVYTFKKRKTLEAITRLYGSSLGAPAQLYSGVMAFIGSSNADGSIFIGHSERLQTYRIVFHSSNVSSAIENFRDLVFLNQENREIAADLIPAEFSGTHVCSIEDYRTRESFNGAVRQTVQVQERRTPKIEETRKGTLTIGTSSSATFCEIFPNVEAVSPETVSSIKTKFSFKQKEAERINSTFIHNSPTAPRTIVAKHLLSLFSKPTSTPILGALHFDVSRNYPTDNVAVPQDSSRVITSRTASSLNRSLKSVENKLLQEETREESMFVLGVWLQKIYSVLPDSKEKLDKTGEKGGDGRIEILPPPSP